MKLLFFSPDPSSQLRKVSHTVLAGLWSGSRPAARVGDVSRGDLPIACAVLDHRLLPRRVYLARLPLTDGRFTDADYRTLGHFGRPGVVTAAEAGRHHAAGWPDDLVPQLAVALDVPAASLTGRLRAGGPLLVAARDGVSLAEAARLLG